METELVERAAPLLAEFGEWKLEALDNQPILEGKKFASDRMVTITRNGEVQSYFLYPGYRIYTLLAHWREGIPSEVQNG